jgi:hypothetical protein
MTIANAWLETRPATAPVHLTADELADVLRALETAYEGAFFYSDIGAVPYGPFEGLPRALRLLRRLRDEQRLPAVEL